MLKSATFVALGGRYQAFHGYREPQSKQHCHTQDTTVTVLILFGNSVLLGLEGFLNYEPKNFFKVRPWPRLFPWKRVASSSTRGLWHRKAAWLQTLYNERSQLSKGNIYNMDESKPGEAGGGVLEGHTVSFYPSLHPSEYVEGESWGPKRG